MFCPKCNMPRPNDVQICSQCGGELIAPPKRKKGKLWPPIVLMVLMLVAGSVLFVLTRPEPSEPTASATPWFSVEDGILYFYEDLYTGGPDLEIPTTVDGQTVTELAAECFKDCDELESVILPDTLETIGSEAFMGCQNLRAIKLTEKVQTIASEAFYNCPSLEAIYIPKSVKTVGTNAFSGCFSLEHVFFAGDKAAWTKLYPQGMGYKAKIYQVSGPNADSYTPL